MKATNQLIIASIDKYPKPMLIDPSDTPKKPYLNPSII